eukprot:scaffold106174_cov19-Tisochrysis_lutea.AAC.1
MVRGAKTRVMGVWDMNENPMTSIRESAAVSVCAVGKVQLCVCVCVCASVRVQLKARATIVTSTQRPESWAWVSQACRASAAWSELGSSALIACDPNPPPPSTKQSAAVHAPAPTQQPDYIPPLDKSRKYVDPSTSLNQTSCGCQVGSFVTRGFWRTL